MPHEPNRPEHDRTTVPASVMDSRKGQAWGDDVSALRVFISYRRDDSEDATGRLYDALAAHFGAERVFMDIDTIPLGSDFAKVISDAVSACHAFVVVIGKQWLTISDDSGGRRLDNPEDWVRLEITAALERGLPVIPVLVQGAEMPESHELPTALAVLARRNGIAMRGATWGYGVERLIAAIEEVEQDRAARGRDGASAAAPSREERYEPLQDKHVSAEPVRSRRPCFTTPASFVLGIASALFAVAVAAGTIIVATHAL
jgi:hypothetical protein